MTALIVLGVAYIGTFAAFLWLLRQADEKFAGQTALYEGTLKRLLDQQDGDRKERGELLTRIQAPKDAPFVLNMSGDKQHVGLEDDEGYWEAERERNGHGE